MNEHLEKIVRGMRHCGHAVLLKKEVDAAVRLALDLDAGDALRDKALKVADAFSYY